MATSPIAPFVCVLNTVLFQNKTKNNFPYLSLSSVGLGCLLPFSPPPGLLRFLRLIQLQRSVLLQDGQLSFQWLPGLYVNQLCCSPLAAARSFSFLWRSRYLKIDRRSRVTAALQATQFAHPEARVAESHCVPFKSPVHSTLYAPSDQHCLQLKNAI